MANFELTREFLEQVQDSIELNDDVRVVELLEDMHPADIAELYRELNIDEAKYLYLKLDDERAADVLTELEEDERKRFLDALPSDVIAKRLITNLESDDAADVLGEMDDERQQEVLSHMEDMRSAGDIVALLNYDDDTAGGLMAKEFIKVKVSWDITTCMRSMRRQGEKLDEVYYVYVVDNEAKLMGTLSLKRLLLTSEDALVSDIYNEDVISVKTEESADVVAQMMDKYDLVAMPVIDSLGRLVGRITIDDIVDHIRDEAEKDYQLASGITDDVESSDNVWQHTRARMPWLLLGMLGGILGSQVVGGFVGVLDEHPQLALFMGLIAAMGGNIGMQSSAIIVQSLASGNMGLESTSRKLLKEVSVAVLNALILSVIIFAYNLIIGAEFALTYSVSIALFSVVVIASLFGTCVPMFMKRMGIDPAVATGPFVTTLNDIIGMFIYLSVGTFCYSVFY